ncbi:MAG: S-layer y domain protein [Firmicutes bacterium]|nr:S-layer y domain protein [Bacillota bacterium]
MKKTLIVTLALVFVLGIAGTAFAATNPFVDVPAKHWAYGSITQLANAGIIDGYGDGTFRGDQLMTRYEMAQIVAKAMAKSDKANAEQKAMIDKLAAEFAAELNNLGVRVTALEKNQPTLKFAGDFRVRYTSIDNAYQKNADGTYDSHNGVNIGQYRLRLDAVAKVDDNTSFAMRFVTREPDKANLANSTWQGFGGVGQDSSTMSIDRVNMTTKLGAVNMTIGRQALKIDNYDVVMDSGAYSFDGVKIVNKFGDITMTSNYGRFLKGAKMAANNTWINFGNGVNDPLGDLDVQSVKLDGKSGKLAYGVGYSKFNNPVYDQEIGKWIHGNVSYLFNNQFSIGGEYVKNSSDLADALNENNILGDSLWYVKMIAGDQALNKKGAKQFFVNYANVGGASMWNGFSSLNNHTGVFIENAVDYTMWDIGVAYAFSKNFNWNLTYTMVRPDSADAVPGANPDTNMWRTVATVNF